MKSARLFLFIYVVAIATLGCGQKLVFSGGATGEGKKDDGGKCVPGTITKTLPTKFLFLVDQSGSNFDGPYEHPGDATDPQKTFRYGVINDFFQKHGSKPYISWGFITFNGSSAHALIAGSDDQHPLFGGASSMSQALQAFQSTQDKGDTPYKAALKMARDLIQQDMASSAVSFQYRVAILTDGYPTDYCPDPTQPCTIPDSAIISDVQNIISLSKKSVEFSAVYYGLPDQSAAARLQLMAKVGGGQFVDTNVTKVINLDDVITIPSTCP